MPNQNLPRKITASALGAAQKLLPIGAVRRNAGKRVIAQFADSLGWVYFGHVDQHHDEHVFVQGFTASAKHFDAHYSVGNMDGYDMILLQRTDAVFAPGKPSIDYRWLILKIDLKTKYHPHFFASPVRHSAVFYEYFFIKHHRFRQVNTSYWQQYDPLFIQNFTVFAPIDKAPEVAEVLSPGISTALAQHFKEIEFEVQSDALYLYASNQHITTELLRRMVKNGAWLAAQLDSRDT